MRTFWSEPGENYYHSLILSGKRNPLEMKLYHIRDITRRQKDDLTHSAFIFNINMTLNFNLKFDKSFWRSTLYQWITDQEWPCMRMISGANGGIKLCNAQLPALGIMLQWPVINNDLSSHHFHANKIGIFITSHSSGTQTVRGELVSCDQYARNS